VRVNIGKILKAQGIRGEIKISCLLDQPSDISKIEEIICGEKSYKVLSSRALLPTFAVLALERIADRNAAETLVGLDIYVKKEALKLPADRFLIDDLLGCGVYLTSGEYLGKIKGLSPCVSADIIHCEGEKNVSFPFLKDLTAGVDIKNKKLLLNSKRFYEVCVYED
jgi:16S rRNA processing protein RimM